MNLLKSVCCPLTAITLLTVLLMTSCTKSGHSDGRPALLAYVADDALVMTLDPAALLKSAGAKEKSGKLVLPEILDEGLENLPIVGAYIDIITDAKGVDRSTTVMAGNNDHFAWMVALSDPDAFRSWAKGNDYHIEEVEQYTALTLEDDINELPFNVVTKGNVAWIVPGKDDATEAVRSVKSNNERASENPLAPWKVAKLLDDDINYVLNLNEYSNILSSFQSLTIGLSIPSFYALDCAYVAGNLNFDGSSISFNSECLDNDGKTAPIFAEGTYEPLNSGLISLIKDKQIAIAGTVSDSWRKMMRLYGSTYNDNSEEEGMIETLMSSTKSFALGASFNGNLFAGLNPNSFWATIALEMDKDKAEPLFKQVADLAGSPYSVMINNITGAWFGNKVYAFAPQEQMPDFKLYAAGKGDIAMLTTSVEVAEEPLKNDQSYDKLIAYLSIDINKSHPLLTMIRMPFGIKVYGTSTTTVSEGYIKLTDTNEPILKAIIDYIYKTL